MRKMRELRPHMLAVEDDYCHTPPDGMRRDDAVWQNDQFCARMLSAIEAGLEKATVGTIVDNSALIPTIFTPEPRFSGCGSSAGMCAEVVEQHDAGARRGTIMGR